MTCAEPPTRVQARSSPAGVWARGRFEVGALHEGPWLQESARGDFHAQASAVTVSISSVADCVRLVVEDDGVGFDATGAGRSFGSAGGFGLFSIQERMADLGGAFKIVSKPGKGCKAILTVPIETDPGYWNQEV